MKNSSADQIRSFLFPSPVGMLEIQEKKGAIAGVLFRPSEKKASSSPALSPVMELCLEELEEYFRGIRRTFTVPLHLEGTPFQKRVWQALLEIPYGETRSYQDIAAAVGNPKAPRAVGGANNKNPVALIVPCHRVIGKNGSLVGFGGGLHIKEWLLAHEKRHASESRKNSPGVSAQ
ncbi:MAG TPA: methylated-DNA--[protein]-cysteine S-methyltransferase [Synergistaceae bacterium]|nr:methylated-DNA--[protein]-cysteine S-methyltransferase [Synergistaceae bacterium]HPQ36272.1 methylated-DNA--[protein]-cysteine S-methyltransferase [Synergistaceae bacterium]